jgi:hypothetical protein
MSCDRGGGWHAASCPEFRSLGEAELDERALDELPDLGVELRRLEALVRAWQAIPTDAERRRALNYMRDRFPMPSATRSAPL